MYRRDVSSASPPESKAKLSADDLAGLDAAKRDAWHQGATRHHTQEAVLKLFGAFRGFLQSDASNVFDILERGPPKDEDADDGIKLVGCWAHCEAPW